MDSKTYWLQCIRDWFPKLHSETYFLPPLHFNQVPHDLESVAQVPVLVLHPADSSAACPSSLNSTGGSSLQSYQRKVQDNDIRNDNAQRLVLRGLHALADKLEEVMVVVSQLLFRNYLNKPSYAATVSYLSRPVDMDIKYREGDFDVLIIHKKYGLIAGEIKSVGANFAQLNAKQEELDAILAKKVAKAVTQLNKSHCVLQHLITDLNNVNVIKVLMLPNITSTQLLRVLNRNPQSGQALCSSLGTETTDKAVRLCLCSDQLSSRDSSYALPHDVLTELCNWWRHLLDLHRDCTVLSPEIYEELVARFCGPATTVEVYCITPPRVEIRTKGEGVAEAGHRIALLCLYPEQIEILNSVNPRVFLLGPPGTGKTVMLYLKGVQWLNTGYDVHVVNTCQDSRASSYMLEHQLLQTKLTRARPSVHLHRFDFGKSSKDVKTAVKYLKRASRNGQLCILADEVDDQFDEFCTQVVSRVHDVLLWAASMFNDKVPKSMTEEKLTIALRSPPVVVNHLEWFIGDEVHSYKESNVPAVTDGPEIRRLHHISTPGHTEDGPIENCEECGRDIARVLVDLKVGIRGNNITTDGPRLQYHDVIVLCNDPRDDKVDSNGHVISTCSGLVRGLRAVQMPVRVVERDAPDDDIRDLAQSFRDEMIVTVWENVQGLERKVVVVKEIDDYHDYLHHSSRSTSQLVLIDCEVKDELDDGDILDDLNLANDDEEDDAMSS